MTAKKLTLKELMFRSTIYDRHEKRRAKTLLRKSDKRPAVLRVFFPPVVTAAATVAGANRSVSNASNDSSNGVESSSSSFSSASTSLHLESPVPTMEDDSVFTLHDVPPVGMNDGAATSITTCRNTTSIPSSSIFASIMAGTVGAIFSEAVYGARCLRGASPFASSPTRVPLLTGQPKIVWHPEYATLMMQSTLSQERRLPLFQGLSQAQLFSRAAPVAVLFGVKSGVEHLLTRDTTKASPPAAVSMVASAVSGGILGALRSVLPSFVHGGGGGLSVVGCEMAGATLYFSAYGGIKHLFSNKADAVRQNSSNPIVTLMAGATAGVLYDGVRSCHRFMSTLEPPLARAQTRSIMMTMIRSAPSHALLFLGYEATLGLFR